MKPNPEGQQGCGLFQAQVLRALTQGVRKVWTQSMEVSIPLDSPSTQHTPLLWELLSVCPHGPQAAMLGFVLLPSATGGSSNPGQPKHVSFSMYKEFLWVAEMESKIVIVIKDVADKYTEKLISPNADQVPGRPNPVCWYSYLLCLASIWWIFECCCYPSAAKSCPTLHNPMDCSPPGFSVRGISQARILEWVAFPFPGDLPDPGIEESPALAGRFFTSEPPGEPLWML